VTRVGAQERLGRLLAIVPWVASQDGPPVAEVCERFGIGEGELLADLGLLFLCGVHPFTPDTLIEVDVADGRVWIRFADWFRRPLRLTPTEGLALAGAGSALLDVPGADPDGALASALSKLETVLGVGADDAFDVELGEASPSILETVREATRACRKLRIEYYSFGRDGFSSRVVQPWRVFNALGHWYLSGWCEQAGSDRLFRLDRITATEVLVETFDPPPAAAGPGDAAPEVFSPAEDDPVMVVELDREAFWVAEEYPNEGVEQLAGGRLRVRLRVSHRAWMERLLLRAGRHLTVVEGDRAVGREAARRLLARYRDTGDDPLGPEPTRQEKTTVRATAEPDGGNDR
jgi:proteasome accessory factor C